MLGPGQSHTISVTTAAVGFAVQGSLNLVVAAKSRSIPLIQASATAGLQIASTVGLAAHFDPVVNMLAVFGTADFILLVENTGNTEDAYTATITGTTGAITASLVGIDGLVTQTIPTFRLPGLSTGAIAIRTNSTAFGSESVTVRVAAISVTVRPAGVVLVGYREFGVGAGHQADARVMNDIHFSHAHMIQVDYLPDRSLLPSLPQYGEPVWNTKTGCG